MRDAPKLSRSIRPNAPILYSILELERDSPLIGEFAVKAWSQHPSQGKGNEASFRLPHDIVKQPGLLARKS